MIGLGPYTAKVELADSGGIFPDASVSYRGVEIGKVGDMRVTPQGLKVDLEIEQEAPPVPTSSMAVIANRSAVGEQYVDLQPPNDRGPYLDEDSVIPVSQTRTPVPVDQLLADVNSLATSVPLPELRTTVDELFNAFDRAGPDLQRLLDSSNALIPDAIANLPQTRQLLRDGRIVLTSQSQLGPQITFVQPRSAAVHGAAQGRRPQPAAARQGGPAGHPAARGAHPRRRTGPEPRHREPAHGDPHPRATPVAGDRAGARHLSGAVGGGALRA